MRDEFILEKIRELRDSRKWSEYKLSEESGLPQSTISSWFRHKSSPSVASLDAICKAFNMTLSQFFYECEKHDFSLSDEQKKLIILSQKLTSVQLKCLIDFLSEI